MLAWILLFLVATIETGVFAFGGIAPTVTGVAKILFSIFLILLLGTFLFAVFSRRGPPS